METNENKVINEVRDRFNSRKFVGLLVGWLILMSIYQLTPLTVQANSLYSVFMTGIISLYGIYCGANSVNAVFGEKKKESFENNIINNNISNESQEIPEICEACGKVKE